MSAGKTSVLITGCSPGGIGHALAMEFHKRGCHVIATARNTAALESMGDLGMSVVQLDVTDTASIAACKAEVATITGGKLDILINNAGRTHTIPALDMELDDVRATYETNVFGPMLMCQAFIGLLIPARGLIINISSVSTVVPYLFGAIYSSTKGAINVYSRALRLELQPFGVRVMVAMTGTVRSNIASHFPRALPPGSLYRPVDDVFQWRLTFSQTRATMPTEVYARKLAGAALRGEGWFGGLVGGSPDWFWAGGMALTAWISTFMPAWLSERLVASFFRVGAMGKRIRAAARAKKD
ncbi:NADPH-dependent 1-acyldihydroxyacetone phosphate reductase [Tolypocladium paradoxum]|uniref:NADPH-dependent 1-acyldihydroxyacetone phosphate reductase n=1 Tax=Tolypocladium paradoxum TaxID=94208 RepID=A0A2S4KSA5_9HYPO|nr:NADPH-dependent 1-acyldihydroxyacetone phosphate reductase [Tolypocladium paradoxum]